MKSVKYIFTFILAFSLLMQMAYPAYNDSPAKDGEFQTYDDSAG